MALTKNEKKIRKCMTNLHTYKPEYDTAIKICADLMDQYELVNNMITSGVVSRFDITEAGGTKKSAAVTTAEALRKDILAYLKELGLTVMSVKKLDVQDKLPASNVLADALRRLGGADE